MTNPCYCLETILFEVKKQNKTKQLHTKKKCKCEQIRNLLLLARKFKSSRYYNFKFFILM